MRTHWGVEALCLSVGILALAGCDDNPTETNGMVMVSGEVRSIDDGTLAPGVRVTLLGTEFTDEVETGTDGAFSIQVPKGSPLLFLTDDFDQAGADEWFPTLNVEHPPRILNENLSGWLIHSCPATEGMEIGSVAAWNNYLANGDAANGDLFVPEDCASSGGILAFLVLGGATPEAPVPSPDFTVTFDAPEFPIVYFRDENTWSKGGTPDPNLGPDMFFPADRTVTDQGGGACTFGDPAVTGTGTELTLTIIDADASRNMQWQPSSFTVPMLPGTISLVLPCHFDGVPNIPVTEWSRLMGWRP